MPEPKNRKFLAQKEKVERQKKIIVIATAAILAIVLGLVAYGIIDQRVIQPNKAVIELESRSIPVNEFEERVRYQRFQLINQAFQIAQIQQSLGSDPQMAAYFQQQLNQIIQQLQQPLLMGQQVVQSASDDLIIFEEAEKRGIEISEEELDREMEKIFGYFPGGTPTPLPTFEVLPTSTLTSQQLTLVPPTPTVEDSEGSEEGEAAAATQTPQTEPEEDPDRGPTATPLLQPTEYTEELYQERYQETIDSLETEAQLSEATFRKMVKAFVLRERLREQVTADVDRTQEQVWARHILVDDQETAEEVLQKLAEGEKFADLAAEYSTDNSNKDNGGSLGWFGEQTMIPAFAEVAFSLDIGEISEPVQTDFGWHIIQVLGHEDRPISESAYQQLQDQAFSQWLESKRDEYRPEINPDWMAYVSNEPPIPPELQQFIDFYSQQQNAPPSGE